MGDRDDSARWAELEEDVKRVDLNMDGGRSGRRSDRFFSRFRNAVSRDSGKGKRGSESAEAAHESTTESQTEPVSERRREQIRRAQRLHRQRKAEQSQRLTAEMADLRSKDAMKTARIDHLEHVVTFLSDLLNQHGIVHEIPVPPLSGTTAQVSGVQTKGTATTPPTQRLQIALPQLIGGALGSSPSKLPDTAANLGDVQTGIDFVLSLEHPCMYHHHGPANNDDDLLGHSSMMQAPIMARAPPLVTTSGNAEPVLPSKASWTVPAEELERLLSFSNQLRLPVEITPVQVWSQIRERGSAGWFPSQTALEQLLQTLAPKVFCYGFGAVLDKATVEGLLDQYTRAI